MQTYKDNTFTVGSGDLGQLTFKDSSKSTTVNLGTTTFLIVADSREVT